MRAKDYPCRVWSPVEGRLHVVFPYQPDNRAWLRSHGIRAEWDSLGRRWYVSRSKINVIVNALLSDKVRCKHGEVLVIRDGLTTQRCDTRCQNAKGSDCVCSCAGKYHRTGASGTALVSDTTLVVGEEINRSWTVVTSKL